MTRLTLSLLAALMTLGAAGPALALNPQPLPPILRCLPYCAAKSIPAMAGPHARIFHSHRGR